MATTVDGPASWDPHARTLHRVALAAARPSSPDAVRRARPRDGRQPRRLGRPGRGLHRRDADAACGRSAALLDGRLLTPFEYALAGTPCEQVVGKRVPPRRRAAWPTSTAPAACSPPRAWTRTRRSRCATATASGSACSRRHGPRAARRRRPRRGRAQDHRQPDRRRARAVDDRRRAAARRRSPCRGVGGATVFAELARSLAEILHVDIAFIARPDGARRRARWTCWRCSSTATSIDDGSYALAGTPCEGVLRDGFRVVSASSRRVLPRRRADAARRHRRLRRLSARRPRRRRRSAWSRSRRARRCAASTGSSR